MMCHQPCMPKPCPVFQSILSALPCLQFSLKVVMKEQLISGIPSIPIDQRAIIDFIIMSRAQAVVGHPFSTFSMYLRSYRKLVLGLPDASFHMIDTGGMMDAMNKGQAAQNRIVFDLV